MDFIVTKKFVDIFKLLLTLIDEFDEETLGALQQEILVRRLKLKGIDLKR